MSLLNNVNWADAFGQPPALTIEPGYYYRACRIYDGSNVSRVIIYRFVALSVSYLHHGRWLLSNRFHNPSGFNANDLYSGKPYPYEELTADKLREIYEGYIKGDFNREPTQQTQPTESKAMPQNIHSVVIIQRPTAEQRERVGAKDVLILGPVQVMADNNNTAIAVAVQQNHEALAKIDLCNVEIKVQAF